MHRGLQYNVNNHCENCLALVIRPQGTTGPTNTSQPIDQTPHLVNVTKSRSQSNEIYLLGKIKPGAGWLTLRNELIS